MSVGRRVVRRTTFVLSKADINTGSFKIIVNYQKTLYHANTTLIFHSTLDFYFQK